MITVKSSQPLKTECDLEMTTVSKGNFKLHLLEFDI